MHNYIFDVLVIVSETDRLAALDTVTDMNNSKWTNIETSVVSTTM